MIYSRSNSIILLIDNNKWGASRNGDTPSSLDGFRSVEKSIQLNGSRKGYPLTDTLEMPKKNRNHGLEHGSLNVPIEHHPTIRYMVYNGCYKVMSNIPKMGHLPTPVEYGGHGEYGMFRHLPILVRILGKVHILSTPG